MLNSEKRIEGNVQGNYIKNLHGYRTMSSMGVRRLMTIAVMTILTAGTSAIAAPQTVIIDDFEKGDYGWSGYSDREEKPKIKITDEAISGSKALEVTLTGCKSYQGFHLINASALPKNAVAISFLIKPISGVPPIALTLENSELKMKTDSHTAVALGLLSLKGNDWQKVRVPFSTLIYGSGPKQDKPFPALEPGIVYTIRFYGPVVDNPSVFMLDDIKWETE